MAPGNQIELFLSLQLVAVVLATLHFLGRSDLICLKSVIPHHRHETNEVAPLHHYSSPVLGVRGSRASHELHAC